MDEDYDNDLDYEEYEVMDELEEESDSKIDEKLLDYYPNHVLARDILKNSKQLLLGLPYIIEVRQSKNTTSYKGCYYICSICSRKLVADTLLDHINSCPHVYNVMKVVLPNKCEEFNPERKKIVNENLQRCIMSFIREHGEGFIAVSLLENRKQTNQHLKNMTRSDYINICKSMKKDGKKVRSLSIKLCKVDDIKSKVKLKQFGPIDINKENEEQGNDEIKGKCEEQEPCEEQESCEEQEPSYELEEIVMRKKEETGRNIKEVERNDQRKETGDFKVKRKRRGSRIKKRKSKGKTEYEISRENEIIKRCWNSKENEEDMRDLLKKEIKIKSEHSKLKGKKHRIVLFAPDKKFPNINFIGAVFGKKWERLKQIKNQYDVILKTKPSGNSTRDLHTILVIIGNSEVKVSKLATKIKLLWADLTEIERRMPTTDKAPTSDLRNYLERKKCTNLDTITPSLKPFLNEDTLEMCKSIIQEYSQLMEVEKNNMESHPDFLFELKEFTEKFKKSFRKTRRKRNVDSHLLMEKFKIYFQKKIEKNILLECQEVLEQEIGQISRPNEPEVVYVDDRETMPFNSPVPLHIQDPMSLQYDMTMIPPHERLAGAGLHPSMLSGINHPMNQTNYMELNDPEPIMFPNVNNEQSGSGNEYIFLKNISNAKNDNYCDQEAPRDYSDIQEIIKRNAKKSSRSNDYMKGDRKNPYPSKDTSKGREQYNPRSRSPGRSSRKRRDLYRSSSRSLSPIQKSKRKRELYQSRTNSPAQYSNERKEFHQSQNNSSRGNVLDQKSHKNSHKERYASNLRPEEMDISEDDNDYSSNNQKSVPTFSSFNSNLGQFDSNTSYFNTSAGGSKSNASNYNYTSSENTKQSDYPFFASTNQGGEPSFANKSRGYPSFANSNQGGEPSFANNLGGFSSFANNSGNPSFASTHQGREPSFANTNQGREPSFSNNSGEYPSFASNNQGREPSFAGNLGGYPSYASNNQGREPSFVSTSQEREPSFANNLGYPPFSSNNQGREPFFASTSQRKDPSFTNNPAVHHPFSNNTQEKGYPSFGNTHQESYPSFGNTNQEGHPSFTNTGWGECNTSTNTNQNTNFNRVDSSYSKTSNQIGNSLSDVAKNWLNNKARCNTSSKASEQYSIFQNIGQKYFPQSGMTNMSGFHQTGSTNQTGFLQSGSNNQKGFTQSGSNNMRVQQPYIDSNPRPSGSKISSDLIFKMTGYNPYAKP